MQGCQRLRGEAHRERGCPGSRVAARRIQTHGPREAYAASTADRLTPSRASLACRGWKTPKPAAAPITPDNDAVLSIWGADAVRGVPHVAADALQSVEDGISRQRNSRRCLPMY
ncbi:hypothetical protein TcCL_NonESM10815 [Trypanosoma cruzi]|nr:hypothetical protein TcCL_NonESM10815 [Trypanosoma cruzi]